MEFDWDEEKNRRNIEKHGLSFGDAKRIFDGFTVDLPDERFDYGEERIISIGLLDNVAVLVVVHTDRNGICRLISARQASKKERLFYDQKIRETTDG